MAGELLKNADAEPLPQRLKQGATLTPASGDDTVFELADATVPDGADVAQGAKADRPVTDSSQDATEIALLKGLVQLLKGQLNISIGQDTVGLATDISLGNILTELKSVLDVNLSGNSLSDLLDVNLAGDSLTGAIDVAVQGSLGTVEGTDAHDAAATANPLMNGGIYDASPTAVQDGDAVRARLNEVGDVPIVPLGAVEDSVESVSGDRVVYNGSVYQLSRTNNDISTTPSTLIAAPSAGTNIVIWSLDLTTDTQQKITLNDGVGGSAIYTTFAGAYSGIVANPDGPIAELSDANALEAVLGSGGNASINISYILV